MTRTIVPSYAGADTTAFPAHPVIGQRFYDRENAQWYTFEAVAGAGSQWVADSVELAEDSVTSDALADGAVIGSKIAEEVIEGAHVKESSDNTVGSKDGELPITFRFTTSGSGTENIDMTMEFKIRVIDAWLVHGGAGDTGDTVQITDGSAAITDAMDASGADNAIVRAGTIDDSTHEIAASGTLRVAVTDADSSLEASYVYVLAVRVA